MTWIIIGAFVVVVVVLVLLGWSGIEKFFDEIEKEDDDETHKLE